MRAMDFVQALIMLINNETWVSLDINVKGEIYEGFYRRMQRI